MFSYNYDLQSMKLIVPPKPCHRRVLHPKNLIFEIKPSTFNIKVSKPNGKKKFNFSQLVRFRFE